MRITKLGHACVRLQHDGTTVVVDPGSFTAPGATDGADLVLVTHEHPDHWTAEHLAATDAPVRTVQAVADAIRAQDAAVADRVIVVTPGEVLDPAEVGLPVTAVGEWHNVIHRELPRVHNTGYLVTLGETVVYHPGDALTVPGVPVDVLLAPASAPWLRSEMAIDFVRQVGAPVNVAIHDAIYSEAGHTVLAAQMAQLLPRAQAWLRLADGDDLPV